VCHSLQGYTYISAAACIFSAGNRHHGGRSITVQLEGVDIFVIIMINHVISVSINFYKLKFKDIKWNENIENLEISATR
jgi:hypothetical protein